MNELIKGILCLTLVVALSLLVLSKFNSSIATDVNFRCCDGYCTDVYYDNSTDTCHLVLCENSLFGSNCTYKAKPLPTVAIA